MDEVGPLYAPYWLETPNQGVVRPKGPKMKRSIIILSLLMVMVAIPFAMSDKMGSADANSKPMIATEPPIIQKSMSAEMGQVWTLAGSNVTNGFFVVSKVERHNGVMIVHGRVEGLIKNVKTSKTEISDMPHLALSLSAFNRSVVQLVGEKVSSEDFEAEYSEWANEGAPVSSATIAELANRRFS